MKTFKLLKISLVSVFISLMIMPFAGAAEIQYTGLQETSGFVDENGNPISIADYEKIKAEQEKGVFEKYPVPSALVGLVIIGGIACFIVNKTKKHR